MEQTVERLTSFDYGKEQLGFKIKIPVMSPYDMIEEGKSAKRSDIKLANLLHEEKRLRLGRSSIV